jgi:3-phenylpropionate/trans-cinnamate dioxygenase ferredoxin subunit
MLPVTAPKAVTSWVRGYFSRGRTSWEGEVNLGEYVKVCELSDIPPGTMYPADVRGASLMIVNAEGTLFAVDRICTHATADLSTGFLSDSEVTCPLHLSRFNVTDGKVLSPPATEPLRTYELKVEGSGVYVQV